MLCRPLLDRVRGHLSDRPVVALPPKGTSLSSFQKEDYACRNYAFGSDNASQSSAAATSDRLRTGAIGTASGAAAGAPLVRQRAMPESARQLAPALVCCLAVRSGPTELGPHRPICKPATPPLIRNAWSQREIKSDTRPAIRPRQCTHRSPSLPPRRPSSISIHNLSVTGNCRSALQFDQSLVLPYPIIRIFLNHLRQKDRL
jgi:hypothetical protein